MRKSPHPERTLTEPSEHELAVAFCDRVLDEADRHLAELKPNPPADDAGDAAWAEYAEQLHRFAKRANDWRPIRERVADGEFDGHGVVNSYARAERRQRKLERIAQEQQ